MQQTKEIFWGVAQQCDRCQHWTPERGCPMWGLCGKYGAKTHYDAGSACVDFRLVVHDRLTPQERAVINAAVKWHYDNDAWGFLNIAVHAYLASVSGYGEHPGEG